jgi:AraC-like DNA-binding protein
MFAPLRENLYYISVKKIHFLFFLLSSLVCAQSSVTIEDINKKFEEANSYAHKGNPEKAFPILDEIKKDCESIDYKLGITRIGHTLAIIYFNSTNYKKVITLDDEYLKVGLEIKDYEKLSHIHRLKGAAYSELGLLNKANKELTQALQYANKIKPGSNKQHALSVIYGNRASHLMKSAKSQDSVFVNINKSIAAAEKISEDDDSFISKKYSLIAYSYIILASEYFKSDNLELAEDYYHKALYIHSTRPVPLIEKVVLLNELGFFYNDQKEYDIAIKYAEQGLELEKKASFPQLRRDLFETLSKSYLELHKTEHSKKYLNLFTTLNDSITNVDKKAVDTALSTTVSKQEKKHHDDASRRNFIYLLSSIALIVIGISFFLYYQSKKQQQIKKIEAVLEKLKARHIKSQDVLLAETENVIIEEQDAEKEAEEKEEAKKLIPAETEKKLLVKLDEFEKKQLYLERKVSLSFVASEIESNTKYLSYIIKNHKGKDFNKYINDLRINYIVEKINDDPIYRQYKINVLAEETGFSSHSKFASVFKKTVGVSPSEFINYFEKTKKKNQAVT